MTTSTTMLLQRMMSVSKDEAFVRVIGKKFKRREEAMMATAAAAAAACAVAAAAQVVPAARDHPWSPAEAAFLAPMPRKRAVDWRRPHGAQLIGRDVQIFWEIEHQWHQAHVQYFDPITRLHTVIYLSDGTCECCQRPTDAEGTSCTHERFETTHSPHFTPN